MFVKEFEVKINDNLAFGYLFRVVKESFDIENKRFFPTDVPHPELVAQGWSPIFGIKGVDRRIYYRLKQNGWKHPGLQFRFNLQQEFQPFPRPIVITELIRTLQGPDDFYNERLFGSGNDSWVEIYPQNIRIPKEEFAWPRGKFFAFTESAVTNETLLANTCCDETTLVAYYEAKYSYKEKIGAEEK